MNTELLNLIRLQEADDQLGQTRKTLTESAARLAGARAELEKAEQRQAERSHLQSADEARHRELEGELADLAEKKRKNGNRQLAVKNDGEYAALQKEADFLVRKIDQLEDETLALLDRLGEGAEEISALVEAAAGARAAWETLAAATLAEAQALQTRLEDLTVRRADLAQTVRPDLLKRYEDTARTKGGLAVTAASAGLCLACRLSFPPQVYNELQRNEKISVCPNCGRLIYWREHPDFQAPGAAAP